MVDRKGTHNALEGTRDSGTRKAYEEEDTCT
jgi:hypothetical protein